MDKLDTRESPSRPDSPPPRLLELLQRIAGLASAVSDRVRFALFLALLSGAWLTFYLQGLWGLEWTGVVLLLGFLWLPAALLGYAYVALLGVMELPEMARQIGGALNDAASPAWARLRGVESPDQDPPPRGRLRQLLRLVGILLDLSRIGALPDAARTALGIINPFFIALLVLAYLGTLILTVLAVVAGLVYIV